ncbi:MAG TPA: hypothetical protein VMS12_06905 [Thermoanaerobaculia bacterium]|nr:hypothetical protein [Thermoanaerobaculia bacterium]
MKHDDFRGIRMRRLLVIFAVTATLISFGCRRDADLTQAVTDTSITDPASIAPPEARVADQWLGDFTLGATLDPEGRMPLGQSARGFNAGDTIYFAMRIQDAPAGAIVRTVWYGRDNLKVHEETRQVVAGESYLHFQSPPTESWPPGRYKVEAWAGEQLVRSEEFDIPVPR